jgi:predicted dithiol-disulfide oxidoreductase (DUF899 family)
MDNVAWQRPRVVPREEWERERRALLAREKAFTRERDALNAERRKLPMVAVGKDYAFEGPRGTVGLADLFEGRSQLVVYHFMLDPAHDAGCPGCSHLADNVPHLAHLHARDTTFAMVSRAPLPKLEAFRRRLGWTMPWYSSFGSDFNYDFHATIDESRGSTEWNYRDVTALRESGQVPAKESIELPGISVFLADGGRIYHSYSTYARGLDLLINVYNLLDLTPFGRGEGWDGMPDLDGKGQGWLRHHDRY